MWSWWSACPTEALVHSPAACRPCETSTSAPRSSAPRVAFLLVGMARGFDQPFMSRMYGEHLVAPLTAGGLADFSSHGIYVAIKVEPHGADLGSTDYAALMRAIETLKPRAVSLTNGSVDWVAVQSSQFGARNASCIYELHASYRGLLSSMRRALLLMEADEALRGSLQYDVVFISRPDLFLANPLPGWCHDCAWGALREGREVVTLGGDMLLAMSRTGAHQLSIVIDDILSKPCAWMGGTRSFAGTEQLGELVAAKLARASRRKVRLQVRGPPNLSSALLMRPQQASTPRARDCAAPARPTEAGLGVRLGLTCGACPELRKMVNGVGMRFASHNRYAFSGRCAHAHNIKA